MGRLSSSQRQVEVFQNSNFHLKAPILTLTTNAVICFSCSDRLFLCSFFRKYLLNIWVWITIVCQFFFQVKMVFHEKEKKWLFHLLTYTVTQVLFLETATVLRCMAEMLRVFFQFHHTEYQKHMFLRSRFNIMNNIYCFIKDIVMWTGTFFLLKVYGGEENKDLFYRLMLLPCFLLRHELFHPMTFVLSVRKAEVFLGLVLGK